MFAYTGAASVLAAQDGWQVTHVDAARPSLDWAAQNAAQSGLSEKSVRWMFDDCLKFAQREVRRGNKYHGILLDPPHYGRGPKGEKWQFEEHIAPLLDACRQLLASTKNSFVVISTYAIGYSPLAFENMLRDFGDGQVESGELWLPQKDSDRRLPCGFCARYSR
jgi:23S rRNA (cytosine1962-C5)-methyltransferase